MLRSLLFHADEDPQTTALARDGGRAFVSQSLRPYLLAALLDREPNQPAIVVAGDDRAARDLASALKSWLDPRTVRYYPSRGVTYESHLAPPPHLVGLQIAALDSLLSEGEAPAVRVDLFADEIESLRWFSTFTQRSLGDADTIEVAPAAELAEEHRELAEIAALEEEADRPDIAQLLPVESFHPFLELAPLQASV